MSTIMRELRGPKRRSSVEYPDDVIWFSDPWLVRGLMQWEERPECPSGLEVFDEVCDLGQEMPGKWLARYVKTEGKPEMAIDLFVKCPECGARVAENWLVRHMRREHARADPPSAAILEQVQDLGRRMAGINVYLPVEAAYTEVEDCYRDLQDLVLMLEAQKEEAGDGSAG